MPHSLAVTLLILCFVVGLALIPLGLPGLWVMVLGLIGYGALTDFRTVGVGLMATAVGLAFLGGIAGAIVGLPIPIIGSVIGSFFGSFVGAAVFEYSRSSQAGGAVQVGWGA